MMEIDWDKFSERVPVGTRLKCGFSPIIFWEGVLLENYPVAEIESSYGRMHKRDLERWIEHVLRCPRLRYQDFRRLNTNEFELLKPGVSFHIDSQWLTFEEVMA